MKPEDCLKFNDCLKLKSLQSTDSLDFQYQDAIREVCAKCKDGMKRVLKEVEKVWGRELIIINCPEYCGKLLYLDEGAESSVHYHIEKQETFYCLEGAVSLMVAGSNYMLKPFSRPKTVKPGQRHSFSGLASSVIIEVSTHHDDADVFRLTESKKGVISK